MSGVGKRIRSWRLESLFGFATVFDRIEDDRGRRWKPCEIARASEESGIDRFLIAPPTHRPEILKSAVGMGVIFTVMMVPVQWVAAWIRHGDPGLGIQIMLAPLYLIGFGLPMGYIASARMWRSTAHARDAMLDYDLCPHCAHGLGGIPAEPDGCTVCPECGASWRFTTASELGS